MEFQEPAAALATIQIRDSRVEVRSAFPKRHAVRVENVENSAAVRRVVMQLAFQGPIERGIQTEDEVARREWIRRVHELAQEPRQHCQDGEHDAQVQDDSPETWARMVGCR